MPSKKILNFQKLIKSVKSSVALILISDKANIISKGTGFLIKPGIIATCNHVVDFPNFTINVRFSNIDGVFGARIVKQDKEKDLALIEIDIKDGTPINLGKFDTMEEGDEVFFVGYPATLSILTTHKGIISAKTNDTIGTEIFQIDASVNKGSSGSPLLNFKGEAVGVINAKYMYPNQFLDKVKSAKVGSVQIDGIDTITFYQEIINSMENNLQLGIGYAISSNYLDNLLKEVKKP